ncbi:efflux RND transporter periplasmic adaptor subunit [Novosphingobium sp. M1R2S20]|uniref:Efflux RND transporter periplasmic adaptor subunit n=1 Tax=Novosphingobium rhizovicinum TaxID=3228928 RepID=A0ABV3RH26_9SPHN
MFALRLLLPLAAVIGLVGCSGGGDEETADSSAADRVETSVRVVRAQVESVQSWIYAQGTARAEQREFLTFPGSGRVTYVAPGLDVGERVRRGQLIARLQPDRAQADLANARAAVTGARTDVDVAQANLRQARAQLELTRETFERYQILLRQNSASEQEYDEAEARLAEARAGVAQAQARLAAARAQVQSAQAQVQAAQVTVSETRIVSPINGVLARLNLEQGRYFSPQIVQTQSEAGALQTIPVLVIDASRFEISVDVPSFAARQIEVGSEVLIRPSDAPAGAPVASARSTNAPPVAPSQFEIRGRVTAVSPALDPETRTFQAEIRTTAGSELLQDGEFVSAWIRGAEAPEMLAVPFDAIRYRDNRPFIFVLNPKTRQVDERAVELGLSGANSRAVVSGLRPGELVVTDGNSQINDGDRVRVIGQRPTRPRQSP